MLSDCDRPLCCVQTKRLEAVSRSPVFAMFTECFTGLASIRGVYL